MCTNSTIEANCANSGIFLPGYISLNSNLPCTGCSIIGNRITCAICPDKFLVISDTHVQVVF